jgi:hypothetical protein
VILIDKGPWRIRAGVLDGHAAISYRIDGKSETTLSETHADLVLLRDAITEYLQAAEQGASVCAPYSPKAVERG